MTTTQPKPGGLVLNRKAGESIVIGNRTATLTFHRMNAGEIRGAVFLVTGQEHIFPDETARFCQRVPRPVLIPFDRPTVICPGVPATIQKTKNANRVRLQFSGDPAIPIHRAEIWKRIRETRRNDG